MTATPAPVFRLERQKIFRALVARVAIGAVLLLVPVTSIGGYAAATHSPHSDIGRKAASMITASGWDGYLGLTILSVSVCTLLGSGSVIAWAVGREFTDGTIVGLFAIAASRGAVASAKIGAYLCWGTALMTILSTVSALGGIALGLPPSGALMGWLTVFTAGFCIICSATPIAWVSTRWRGYLPGIGATLVLLVTTNLAVGFGLGRYIPWAIPTLWASHNTDVPTIALTIPILVGVIGAWATRHSWARLQLGRE